MELSLIAAFVSFSRNTIGLVTRPYETCRRIAEQENLLELLCVGIVLALYFSLASLVKIASFRSFFFVGFTYCLVVGLFLGIGHLFGANSKWKGVAVLWGYSLLPTTVWFFITSLLYVLLPPPRTTSVQGILFSLLFLIFSLTLFLWKGTILYLTLRFGLRMGLGKILIVLGISQPILALYSYGMYQLGIFRIPFI